MYFYGGILMIILGALFLWSPETAWRLQKWNARVRGMKPERTDTWDSWNMIFSIILIILGLFFVFFAFPQ